MRGRTVIIQIGYSVMCCKLTVTHMVIIQAFMRNRRRMGSARDKRDSKNHTGEQMQHNACVSGQWIFRQTVLHSDHFPIVCCKSSGIGIG